MQVKKQHELDMEKWTGSKLGKVYDKAVYCYPTYLTNMQSTSCEMLGWMKHEITSRNTTHLRYANDNTLMAESEEELKSLLMKVKEKTEKVRLKVQHSENEDYGIWPHLFMANRCRNSGNTVRLYFWGSKITADGDCSHEIERHMLLGRKAMTNLDGILKT